MAGLDAVFAAFEESFMKLRGSVAVRKFARVLSLLRSELPNLSDTSKPMILVSLLNPKFAKVPAEQSRELRIRDTSLRRQARRYGPVRGNLQSPRFRSPNLSASLNAGLSPASAQVPPPFCHCADAKSDAKGGPGGWR